MVKWLSNGLIAHSLERPAGLLECDVVADIGAGVRPMQWYKPKVHLCVEPSEVYSERLRKAGYEVIQVRAAEYLEDAEDVDQILMLDVIEHMDRNEGLLCLELAMRVPGVHQIVVYTPNGLRRQDRDEWNLGEHELQKHRSGFTEDDFPGWECRLRSRGRGLWAVWTA